MMTHNESMENHKTLSFKRELLYLTLGCGLLLTIHWFKRLWFERVTGKVGVVSNGKVYS